MDKKKISKKQKPSSLTTLRLKKNVRVEKFDPDQYLSADFIGAAIMECLLSNDPEGVVELLAIYLDEHKHFPIKAVFKHKNPTIKTLAKIVSTAKRESWEAQPSPSCR